ncbi:AAA family ATPase [Neorhizobium galegae]|uniref:AAA family ATPase n=1 Tax=Neorhizobium galegae TaxID=399 RepID=UPI0006211FCB|nr:AAA family ATPase [Neorhizobium galegae]KAB1125817.1 ATP-binding protein [Neorhizobium galegae]MCQ1806092.1 ATP-binding protein [Neorhizobium galegae]CDZ55361.1 Ea59 protein [Neorhizobium galegae bv. orientalis]
MLIQVMSKLPVDTKPEQRILVALLPDNWNDWYKWKTMYSVFIFTNDGNRHDLGSVKLAERGAKGDEKSPYRPELPEQGFEQLAESFISVGQDENYYNTLKGLADSDREYYLNAMRDCAFRPELLVDFEDEEVLSESILRSVPRRSVSGRYHRLANGNAEATNYNFVFNLPFGEESFKELLPLTFDVIPESKPPTNVHVLIGRNSVGKTRALNLMVRALITDEAEDVIGSFEDLSGARSFSPFDTEESTFFAGVVSVSFSAFDRFGPQPATKDGLSYSYIGLKKPSPKERDGNTSEPQLKDLGELADEFALSAEACRVGRRKQAWFKALTTLESDPLFQEREISSLAQSYEGSRLAKDREFFKELSSGHGIVLLIVTRLVELVEEQTLVLIDEPETHLHPPLLSAFVRAVSSLLIDRNGVAIAATHSPVVLQEAPSSCVWKLTRSGYDLRAERPENETFGENVGTLTREVFGLEVTKSGFHDLLDKAVRQYPDYDAIISDFGDQLGAEARSILRSLIRNQNALGEDSL